MTPFFSNRVCQAMVRSRKFIHIGQDEDQHDETGSGLPFMLHKIMARG